MGDSPDRASATDLSSEVALVTGGSRGLGREITFGLAAAGADVVVVSRNLDSCERVAAEVRAATGRNALGYSCHVGHWEELPGLVDFVYGACGRLDILVNNAGMSPTYASLSEVSEELFDKVVAVNLKGPFRLSALAGEQMAAAGSGSIVNISSVAATRPAPGYLPYAAAKAGLGALTKGFAQAYGPGVRVNGILAGPFRTDITKGWDMHAAQQRWQRYPLRRAGRPDEIVGAVVYLAGPSASYTTGTILEVDGGMSLV